ncbi:DUF2149 domain-containing protein [Methanopyrus sp.]
MPRYLRRRRRRRFLGGDDGDDDPLTGVANLFDAAMVFALAFILTMSASYGLTKVLNPKVSQATIITKTTSGKVVVTKVYRTPSGIKVEKFKEVTRAKRGGAQLGQMKKMGGTVYKVGKKYIWVPG